MSDTKDNMVLRTVYLPIGLDRELRQLAFTRDVSKADLIREFIRQGLGDVQQSGEKTLADKVEERIKNRETAISEALVSAKPKKRLATTSRGGRRTVVKQAAAHA